MPQPAAFVQRLLDVRVRIEDALAAKQLYGVEKVPAGPDWRVNVETVFLAGQEIVRAMTRRGVYGARSLFQGDVISQHRDRVALVQRMSEVQALENHAFHPGNRLIERT